MNIPDIKLPRVVVIGAGFAGLKLSRNINTGYYIQKLKSYLF